MDNEKDKAPINAETDAAEVLVDTGKGFSIESGDEDIRDLSELRGQVEEEPEGDTEGEEEAEGGAEGSDKEAEPVKETEGEEEEAEQAEVPAKPEDLGEFKAEEAEKWEAAYVKDGSLNQSRLSNEFWSNAKQDSRGALNEGTYKFLASKGISREMVKDVESALVIKADKVIGDINAKAGGNDLVNSAKAWAFGKGKGYDKAKAARFNSEVGSGDQDRMQDAMDLLVTRYKAANPAAGTDKPAELAAKPKVKTTKASTIANEAAAVTKFQPYKTDEEQAAALKAVGDVKDNVARHRAWDTYLGRSAAYAQSKKAAKKA